MLRYDDEPTEERIRELRDYFETAESGVPAQRTKDEKLTKLYFDELGVEVPNTADRRRKRRYEPVRATLNEGRRIVDLLGSFYIDPPRAGVVFTGEGAFSEGKAENVSKAHNEMVDQLNPPTGDRPWSDGDWELNLLGRCVDFICPTPAYYADFHEKGDDESDEDWEKWHKSWKRKAPLPLIWQTLPAASTFPASLSAVDDEVLSLVDKTYSDLQDIFTGDELEAVMPEKRSDWSKSCQLAIYANRQWLAYCVLPKEKSGRVAGIIGGDYNDKIVRKIEHKMGRCPIRIHAGVTTGRKEYPYYWQSVLDPVLGQLENIDKFASAAATSAKAKVLPLLKQWINGLSTQGEGATGAVTTWVEGDIIPLDAGDGVNQREDIAPVLQPQQDQETRELLVYHVERAGRITGAMEILEGQVGPNQPAWSVNSSAELARGKLRPVTNRKMSRLIGVLETLDAALVAFGEDITLAKFDEKGNRAGDIVLKLDEVQDFNPVISADYAPKLPINWRADLDIMAKLMQMALAPGRPGIIISPQWLMEKFADSSDFWGMHYKQLLDVRFALSEKVIAAQEADIARRWQAEMDDAEDMSPDEFERAASMLPDGTKDILRSFIGQKRPTLSPPTQGAVRAGSPFSAMPGGPQPVEGVSPI